MSNCKVIALTNQKGGVGKTTTAVNLGVSLAQQGKKVLLIDADAQANLTMSLGYNRPDDLPVTLSTIMQDIIEDNPIDVQKSILHHGEGVDLLPSNIELSGLEVRLINAISRESVLKTCVNEVKKNYDYCLIDCMPSLGMLTINALAAADSVVIPTQPHYLSAKGLELLLRSVSKVRRQINPSLRIDGILMTMVMPRTNISKEITATVRSAYGQKIKVFDTQIPHSIRAVEATAEGKSIFAYDKGGKVAAAYEQFGKEVAELGERQKSRNRTDCIRYTKYNGDWFIENKTSDYGNIKADSTYGTKRASAYRIIEDTLNLKDTRIFDYVYDENGNKKAVFNHKETTAAQAKQEAIKQALVASLAKRAEKVRARLVEPNIDNMLKITNDGRKLALDQRLIDPMLPDDPNSKVNACVDNVYRIWEEHADTKATQLVFCDLSTPKNDGTFNVYDDIREKLIAHGVPAEQVRFIHEATTDAQKKELFGKVRSGEVRVLLGSTPKMGAGTNVQDRLIAIHNLDCPWRPSERGRAL